MPTGTALAGWLLALASGCGGVDAAQRGPIRLVERVGSATLRSATALDDDARGRLATRFEGALSDAEEGRRMTHAGAWVGPAVRRDQDAGEARIEAALVEVEPSRTTRLRVRVPRDGDAGTPFALELGGKLSKLRLSDAAWVEALFRELGSFQRSPLPVEEGPQGALLEVVFTTGPSTTALLIGRSHAAGDDVAGADFELVQFDERDGWLLDSHLPGRSPHVRAVERRGETRESLVLGVPGEARFELVLPARDVRLSAGAAALFARAGERLELEVRVRGGGREVAARVGLDSGDAGWTPVELALDELAGRAVEVALVARTEDGAASEALLAVGAPIVEGSDASRPPDVVLISLDTVRADRTTAYGYGLPTTPRLAELARESAVFDAAITSASWTLPAHASLFSGQYPDRHRATGPSSRVAAETPWLVDEFRRAGYVTAAFTGGGYVDPEFGFARGFDRYSTHDPAYPPPVWTRHRREAGLEGGTVDVGPRSSRGELLELLSRARRAPLFLFVHTYAAHNYACGPLDLLAVGAPRERVEELLTGFDAVAHAQRMLELPEGEAAERHREGARLLYDASLRVADRLVGDVVDALRGAGRLDETVLVVLSDHGEELYERGELGHGDSVYEELVRVPLLVRAPGLAPARVPDVVSLVDLAPTLAELCGVARLDFAPNRHDGRSLVVLLRGEPLPPRAVLARGDNRDLTLRCLRSRDLKLMREERPGREPTLRLFRLDEDPGETHDLACERGDETRALEDDLFERVELLEALGPGGTQVELSGAVLDSLRELGYVGN